MRKQTLASVGLGVLAVVGVVLIAAAPRWNAPSAEEMAGVGRRFVTGIFEDPSARNPWSRYGPNATVWNNYVSAGTLPFLFDYTSRYDWVPSLAADVPSPLEFDKQQGLWRSTVRLRRDVVWSDGTPVTAHDVAFTFDAIMAFDAIKLGGAFPTFAPAEVLARAVAVDDFTVEFFLHTRDARYRFGCLMAPIFQRGYWEPHVDAALASEDPLNAIFAVDVVDEPVVGPFLRGTWERGAFVDRPLNRRFSLPDSREELFASGAVRLDDGKGGEWTGYGEPQGEPVLTVRTGPNVDAVHYRTFGSQAAGVLALQAGQVSYLFSSLGLEKGFRDQLVGTPGIEIIENPNNSIRYLAFNLRREPMKRLPFRQAVAVLIDREFITERVLQGVAYPLFSVVSPDNVAWYNPNVPVPGQGLSRPDRIREAVRILEQAGFTWARKPQLAADGTLVRPGQGLRMPSGEPMRPLELLAPTESYDALRATFALWAERWMNEVGIPVKKVNLAFNVLISRVTDQQDMDMWILGYSLSMYPTYLNSFFHSQYSDLRGRNTAGYANPEYDRLVEAFLAEADDLTRARELAFELQDMLARDLPWIPLFDTPIVEAYRSDQIRFPTTRILGGVQGGPRPGFIESVALER